MDSSDTSSTTGARFLDSVGKKKSAGATPGGHVVGPAGRVDDWKLTLERKEIASAVFETTEMASGMFGGTTTHSILIFDVPSEPVSKIEIFGAIESLFIAQRGVLYDRDGIVRKDVPEKELANVSGAMAAV